MSTDNEIDEGMGMQRKPLSLAFILLVAGVVVLTLSFAAHAQQTIDEIPSVQYREQGYTNKEAFVAHFISCIQIRGRLEKSHACVDTACVRAHPDWKKRTVIATAKQRISS